MCNLGAGGGVMKWYYFSGLASYPRLLLSLREVELFLSLSLRRGKGGGRTGGGSPHSHLPSLGGPELGRVAQFHRPTALRVLEPPCSFAAPYFPSNHLTLC